MTASDETTTLNRETLNEIVDLLAPLMPTQQERQALMKGAFVGQSVLYDIDYSGSTRIFIFDTISQLTAYGKTSDGKQALWVLLEATRNLVGTDRQTRIDALHDAINVPGRLLFSGTDNLKPFYGSDAKEVERYLRALVKKYGEIRDRYYVDLRAQAPATGPTHPNPLIQAQLRLMQKSDGEGEIVESVQMALRKYPKLVMLGEPGAGKTTSLLALLATAAEDHLQDPEAHPLPVYIELGAWGPDRPDDIIDYARQRLQDEGIKQPPLARALFLLDGLNEMAGAKRETRVQSIHQLLREYKDARVIVTCRAADYTKNVDLDLPRLQVEPLDDNRIRDFVTHYLNKERARPLLTTLLGGWQDERHLVHLARNPFMLSIVVTLYESYGGKLSESRAILFRDLVQFRWEQERFKHAQRDWVEQANMECALGDLAYVMIDEDAGTAVSREWALAHLPNDTGETLLRLADRANLLVAPDKGPIRFYHQLMQEYFAALAWEWRGNPAKLTRMWRNWYEILLIYADLDGENRAKAMDVCLIALNEQDENLSNRRRHEAADLLGYIGDARAVPSLVSALLEGISSAAIALKRLKWQPEDAKSHIAYLVALNERDWSVLSQWGRTSVVPLINILDNGTDETRPCAAEALGEIGDLRAVKCLISALRDTYWPVRCAAAEALGLLGDMQAVESLIVSLDDNDEAVRQSAAEALGRIGGIQAIDALITASRDVDEDVRWVVAEALGHINSIKTVAVLVHQLTDTAVSWFSDERVCDAAAQSLLRIGTPEALAALREHGFGHLIDEESTLSDGNV